MNSFSREMIKKIKSENSIRNVVSQYVTLMSKGNHLVGLCPFHNEKTPSFTVYPEKGSFYCFGCGAGGDVITFIQHIENLNYIDAVKLLAERSGVNIIEDNGDNYYEKLKNKILDINKETARFYRNYLKSANGKWALEYLLGRGLTTQTIEEFGLGCAPKDWNKLISYLKNKGYTEFEIAKADLVAKSQKTGRYYDRFRNRIIFPIKDVRGNVIAFSSRRNPEEKDSAKYMNSSDTFAYKKRYNLFGINLAKNHCDDFMILVEGNMDVISLHQAGFKNAVAPLGTSLTEEQTKLITKYTKEVFLLFDADSAGQKAITRATKLFETTGISVRVVVIHDAKDPDEFIRNNGPDAFKSLIDTAVGAIEYKLLCAEKEIEINSDTSKLKYLSRAAEIIASSDDVLERDIYIGSLSEKYSVSRSALTEKVEGIRNNMEENKGEK